MVCHRQDTWISAMRNDGLDALKETYDVNGVKSTVSPFQARGVKDSYIYKHEKYAHLREGRQQWDSPRAAGGSSSSSSSSSGGNGSSSGEWLEGGMGGVTEQPAS
jgi:uncharacterized membrane protein